MKMLCRLLIVAIVLVPAAALADVTVTDWRGASVAVTEGSVDSDGVEIVYHTAGEGPLVVFVHSISGPWFDWRHQLVALSEHYRVAVMSTRGTNKSGKPQGVEHYAMAKISGDIAAIIRHLGEEKAIVVGQDSGGFYAWHFAMTHPEMTERLVSVGTIHPAGLIRELASNPEQRQASMFQRGMQENPGRSRRVRRAGPQRTGPAGRYARAGRAACGRVRPPGRRVGRELLQGQLAAVAGHARDRGPSVSASASSRRCRRRRCSSTAGTAARSCPGPSTTPGAGSTRR